MGTWPLYVQAITAYIMVPREAKVKAKWCGHFAKPHFVVYLRALRRSRRAAAADFLDRRAAAADFWSARRRRSIVQYIFPVMLTRTEPKRTRTYLV